MTVYNISRAAAQAYDGPLNNIVWISIQEPENDHIHSVLDSVPNLKLKFHDVAKTTGYINFLTGEEEFVRNPPTENHAKKIVEFLLEHQGKNIVVNCLMGVARSGSISKFCVTHLKYTWDQESYKRTHYLGDGIGSENVLLYRYLVQEFEKLNS